MKSKKIALLASILMVTLVVGVYAGMRLSNVITADWTLEESKENLVLYWYPGDVAPTGPFKRGQWNDGIYIALKNTGVDDYTAVIGKFEIWTGAGDDLSGLIQLRYYVTAAQADGDTEGWHTMTGVLTWNGATGRLEGHFGPTDGFPVTVGYNEVTQYGILFDNDAPLTRYYFRAWIEEVP